MNRILLFLAVGLLAIGFSAPQAAPKSKGVALVVKDEAGKLEPLRLHTLNVSVQVIGGVAVTTLDMSFYNDTTRILEGELYFPLGEGQTVTRFALDMGGVLREGVIVEKAKGRQVFESVVRRNIDPGLLEWTKGNTFKARVYPIPGKGYKRCVVAYEQSLAALPKGFLYRLPLDFPGAIDNFKLNVDVAKQDVKPELTEDNELGTIRFERWREAFLAKFEQQNWKGGRQLAFVVPRTPAYKAVMVEEDKESGAKYFLARVAPGLQLRARTMPKSIALWWDASASGSKRDFDKEFIVLEKFLKACGDVSVRLVPFRDAVVERDVETFKIKGGDIDDLKSRLKKLPYDGGTSLGAVDLGRYACDLVLLSSDGIQTYGASQAKTGNRPVLVLASSASAEHPWLRYVADQTGGAYANLNDMTPTDAIKLFANETPRLVAVTGEGYQDLATDVAVPVSGDFVITGRLVAKRATLRLVFGYGSQEAKPKSGDGIEVVVDREKDKTETGFVPRLWAQRKLALLDADYKRNADAILALGREFTIVTRGTSLLVLDRVEDYAQHRIVPPKDLREEYNRLLAAVEKDKRTKQVSHLDQVAVRFGELVKWWDTKFSWEKPVIRDDNKKTEMRNGAGDREDSRPSDSRRMSLSRERSESDRTMPNNAGRSSGGDNAKTKDKGGKEGADGDIQLKKWEPDTPYLKKLKNADDAYATYLDQRAEWGTSSAFFLDVADFFIEKKDKDLALRVLSNIAEMQLENPQLLRILGHRLAQLKEFVASKAVFEEVLKMKEEEPQSYRDLALVIGDAGEPQRALELLWTVVSRPWDGRFPEIDLIALQELNRLVAKYPGLDTSKVEGRFLKHLPCDIRVSMTWDADNCDIDLWVTDPNGEKCYYGHPRTFLGGRLSRDFTGGYGPEEYLLRRAKPGEYAVEANFYGNRQQVIAGATTVQMTLWLNWGTKEERRQEVTLRLKDARDVVKVGTFTIRGKTGG